MKLSRLPVLVALRCRGFALGAPMLILLGYIVYLSYFGGDAGPLVEQRACLAAGSGAPERSCPAPRR